MEHGARVDDDRVVSDGPDRRAALLEAVGHRIRVLRVDARLTQEALAERAGMSPQHLGEIERGRSNPTLVTLDALAEGLGVDLSRLVA